jgi:hypothetical protein
MKLKLEGSEFSQENTVQNNEVTDQLSEQVSEVVSEGVNEGVSEGVSENVLKFNNEDEVLEFVKSKEDLYSKVAVKSEEKELPSDIKKYLEFKEHTGRSYNDFIEYQKDYSELSKEDLVKKFIKETNPEYDELDIDEEFSEMFGYDEDYDDERTINKKTRALKKKHKDALDYFESQKEKWSVPLGSNENTIPQEYKSAKEALENFKTQQEANQEKANYFLNKTDELFSNNFKGFEFKIGEEVIVQKPSNVEAVKEVQKDVSNFFSKFLDEKGLIKDPEGYHKALYVAMNYESILKDVYDTAVARAIENEVKSSKNIDMSIRPSQESIKTGLKFKLV